MCDCSTALRDVHDVSMQGVRAKSYVREETFPCTELSVLFTVDLFFLLLLLLLIEETHGGSRAPRHWEA